LTCKNRLPYNLYCVGGEWGRKTLLSPIQFSDGMGTSSVLAKTFVMSCSSIAEMQVEQGLELDGMVYRHFCGRFEIIPSLLSDRLQFTGMKVMKTVSRCVS